MIYMAVTTDKYELPLAVSESAEELSKMTGIKRPYIFQAIAKNLSGERWGFKFVRVDDSDDRG